MEKGRKKRKVNTRDKGGWERLGREEDRRRAKQKGKKGEGGRGENFGKENRRGNELTAGKRVGIGNHPEGGSGRKNERIYLYLRGTKKEGSGERRGKGPKGGGSLGRRGTKSSTSTSHLERSSN